MESLTHEEAGRQHLCTGGANWVRLASWVKVSIHRPQQQDDQAEYKKSIGARYVAKFN